MAASKAARSTPVCPPEMILSSCHLRVASPGIGSQGGGSHSDWWPDWWPDGLLLGSFPAGLGLVVRGREERFIVVAVAAFRGL
jgi:hypothetical protein